MSKEKKVVDEKMLRKDFGFLGIGGCGGNIVKLFYEKGYPTFFINSSEGDLASLTDVPEALKYHLQGGSGTAQDRMKSQKLFRDNLTRVREIVSENLNVKVLFIVGSTGGGTGSGAVPVLAKYFENLKQIVCTVSVLPADSESYQLKTNAYDCLSQLEQLHDGAAFILDNQGQRNIMNINEQFCYQLDKFLTYSGYSVRGYVDREEIFKLLSTKGMIYLSVLAPTQQNISMLQDSLENGIYAPMEKDKVIRYIGLMQTEEGTVRLEDIHAIVGKPISDFKGYGSEKCICVLAGLSLPYSRLEQMNELAEREGEQIRQNLQKSAGRRFKERTKLDFNDVSPRTESRKKDDEFDWLYNDVLL